MLDSVRHFSICQLAVLLLLNMSGYAQTGMIRGQVIEDASGEGLMGATAFILSTTNGASTDFDGKFEIRILPGTYDLQISFVSFESLTVTDVVVKPGEVTILDGIRLKESVAQLEAVTVTADAIRNSEAALMTVKRKSANLLDGISAAGFRKIGDSDAADAAKRVTGVSVEGNKYVYVRGLGDRYTKTTLNSVDIPGLDPDRNSLQMDIFPTALIDNMLVIKSSVAELPADFTGGVVNIETKDFPEEKISDVSFSLGYTPGMHFNSDYLTYDGGSKDFLGYDDGARALPDDAKNATIPSPVSGDSDDKVNTFLRKFSPVLGAKNRTSFMDYSLGFTVADQIALKGASKLGYIVTASYKSETKFYDDVVYGEYQRSIDPNVYALRKATIQRGATGQSNVLLGGLAGLAFKSGNTKLMLTAMHLQNGESKAGRFNVQNDGAAVGQSGYFAMSDNLEYTQRGLANLLLNGEHYNGNGSWKIDWRISPTLSVISDPDIRKTAFTMDNLDTAFVAGAGGNPSRIWRDLNEVNLVGKLDATKEYALFGEAAKLKFGVSHVYKERDYEIRSFALQFFGKQPDFHGDPNKVLRDEYLYPNGTAYYASANNTPNPNEYNSTVDNTAFYISNEFSILSRLRSILGLRAEKYVQRHTGRDVEYASFGTGNNLVDEKVIDAFDLFPSANIIYALNDEQNLRVSYSKTIARPSFKELSFAQILDPITNRIFNGGLFRYSDWDGKLTETRIDNFDLRWERFAPGGQLISLSVFYKSFDRPIELVRIPEQQTSTEYQPRNVGDGQLFGAEIEVRKNLGFISPALDNFSFTGNFTFVKSEIDMSDKEFNSRKAYEKSGQTIERTRQMAGQSPYIINGGLSYENAKLGLEAGLFYNVKGPTLAIVGGGLFPDVFASPFHSLNLNLNKSFGPEERLSATLRASNLFDDAWEEVYVGFGAEDQYFTRLNPNLSISAGIKYSF